MPSLRRQRLLVCTLLLLCVGGCGTDTPTPEPPDGQALYMQFCAACHGPDGLTMANSIAPNLASQELLRVTNDRFLIASTALGRPGANARSRPGSKMTAYAKSERGPLTDEQIVAIVEHIRGWQVEPSVAVDPTWRAEGDPETGREIWLADCAECHGEDGWGEDVPRLVGTTFHEHASDDYIRQTLLLGRPDSEMPAYTYSDEEMGDLIVFIRALGEENAQP